MQGRRQRSDSTSSAVKSMAASVIEVLPPEGVVLRSEDEYVIWRQFVKARSVSDWREMDLILLAKVVRVEADIRKYQLTIDRIGPIVVNKRGTPVANPLVTVIDTYQRQQLAIIRSMSLSNQAVDPRTLQNNAMSDEEARHTIQNRGAYSLLASPVQ